MHDVIDGHGLGKEYTWCPGKLYKFMKQKIGRSTKSLAHKYVPPCVFETLEILNGEEVQTLMVVENLENIRTLRKRKNA